MAEVEEPVPMCLGLGNVEVGTNERNEDGVEDVEDELVE